MGPLVRLIGQGIGLAHEAIAARKAQSTVNVAEEPSKEENVRESLNPPAYEQHTHYTEDPGASPNDDPDKHVHRPPDQGVFAPQATITDVNEEQWCLDEAAAEFDESEPPSYESTPTVEDDELVMRYDVPEGAQVFGRLELPVILPQRRPRDKTRNCGIDQPTFLKFLKDFHQSSKASPVFNVINLAAFSVGFIPSVEAQVISVLVTFASETSKQIQQRERTNSFLDQMNSKFFVPRGLFCLVLTWKPYSKSKKASVDTSTTIAKTLTPAESEFKEKLKGIRASSGVMPEMGLPEAAPLIFPALDKTAENAETKSTMKEASSFMTEYLDRRAQAAYAHQNPGSKLSPPHGSEKPQFASRYSGPNHPASNGSLLSLLTGGHVNTRAGVDKLRQKYRDHKREKMNKEAAEEAGYGEGVVKEVVPETRVANREGLLKRVFREDVLYLMIANMPSEDELAAAREVLALQKTESQESLETEKKKGVTEAVGKLSID